MSLIEQLLTSLQVRKKVSVQANYSKFKPIISFLHNATSVGVNDTTDARNVFAAIDFLKSTNATDRPFVIFLPISLPHPPYRYSMYRVTHQVVPSLLLTSKSKVAF